MHTTKWAHIQHSASRTVKAQRQFISHFSLSGSFFFVSLQYLKVMQIVNVNVNASTIYNTNRIRFPWFDLSSIEGIRWPTVNPLLTTASWLKPYLFSFSFHNVSRRSLDDDISCWSSCMLLLSWFGALCVRWTDRCGIELGSSWQTTDRNWCESTVVAM